MELNTVIFDPDNALNLAANGSNRSLVRPRHLQYILHCITAFDWNLLLGLSDTPEKYDKIVYDFMNYTLYGNN
jgi:hypothetical protein